MATNYEEVLGLRQGAGDQEVRRAFLLLARKHHPDKSVSPAAEAAAKFRRIRAAYDVLRKRAVFGAAASSSSGSGSSGGGVGPAGGEAGSASSGKASSNSNTSSGGAGGAACGDCRSGLTQADSNDNTLYGKRFCNACWLRWWSLQARAGAMKRAGEFKQRENERKQMHQQETLKLKKLRAAVKASGNKAKKQQTQTGKLDRSKADAATNRKPPAQGPRAATAIGKASGAQPQRPAYTAFDGQPRAQGLQLGTRDGSEKDLDHFLTLAAADELDAAGWQRLDSRSQPGVHYFHHAASGRSFRPAAAPPPSPRETADVETQLSPHEVWLAAGAAGLAAAGWERLESRSALGSFYYFHRASAEAVPAPRTPPVAPEAQLSHAWERRESRSRAGEVYYYNWETGCSQLELPTE